MNDSEELLYASLSGAARTGYLLENFRLFHLTDQTTANFPVHYHDFHKIVIPLSGSLSYHMEGKTYALLPRDILLVPRYRLHRPMINPHVPYERIILWIQHDFLNSDALSPHHLSDCFGSPEHPANQAGSVSSSGTADRPLLLRPARTQSTLLIQTLTRMLDAFDSDEFGAPLLYSALFLQFMVAVNRLALNPDSMILENTVTCDGQIMDILSYINGHLMNDLSADALARRFYISPSYLMHRFRQETGDTLHHYISQKRLSAACLDIKKGQPVLEAARHNGFPEYTTFLRLFRRKYGMSPREYFQIP